MTQVISMPPRGIYLAREVGRLAGVSGSRVGQWARNGYIRSSQGGGSPRLYSFQDVAEAMVVHELLEREVPYREIKNTIVKLRDVYGDWPLTHARLSTSGGRVIAEEDNATYDIGRRGWQQMNADDLERIRGMLHRGGWVVRDLPDLTHIEVDPDRLSGRPTIRGRRIPAAKVARLALVQGGRATLRDDFGLSNDEIHDAERWWAATSKYDEEQAA
jgi:uncharacterized protein (DUF433 family)/DNA-binding transcriptional MerR regulator